MSKLLRSYEELKFELVAEHLGLKWLLERVKKNNPSKDLPYHDSTHCLAVARVAYELHGLQGLIPNAKAGRYEQRLLITAGLLHDWGHSGGRFADDDDNIDIAIAELETHRQKLTDEFGPRFVDEVADLIGSTRWPYHGLPESNLEALLRDADHLYFLTPCGPEAVLEGLRHEAKIRTGVLPTLEEQLAKQLAYVETLQLNTAVAAVLYSVQSKRAVKACTQYVEKRSAQLSRELMIKAKRLRYVNDDEVKYEFVGRARGAGTSEGLDLMVYRSLSSGAYWLRTHGDFAARLLSPDE